MQKAASLSAVFATSVACGDTINDGSVLLIARCNAAVIYTHSSCKNAFWCVSCCASVAIAMQKQTSSYILHSAKGNAI